MSAEGDIVLATPELLRKVVNSLNGQKLPILIHSNGGLINQAMLIGYLIRERGLDVAVTQTVFDPCASASSGCKQGTWSGALGEPELHSVMAARNETPTGGQHRSIGRSSVRWNLK